MENSNQNKIYDLIIVGAGPAGLGASIYASRYKLNHLVIGEEIGGQVTEASAIENYAGFESISGRELMERFQKQAESLGAEILQSSVKNIKLENDIFAVHVDGERDYKAKTIILALGMKPRKLNIPGERELIGKGISYCATCDAMFFRGKEVAVIGGGDAAATAAIHLAEFVKKVYIFHRKETTWNPSRETELKKNEKIELRCCQNIVEVKGKDKMSSLIYQDEKEKKHEMPMEGLFVEIGSVPGIELARQLGVKSDEQDYIIVDQTQATNIAGVYAAGDVTTGSNKFRQIIVAVAEGAVAAGSAYHQLKL